MPNHYGGDLLHTMGKTIKRRRLSGYALGSALCEHPQLLFRSGELRVTTLQTDHELWEYPHNGLFQTLESGKMDRNFAGKGALTIGTALLTDHDCLEVSDCLFNA
jgi:hypothetical protein